VVKKKADTSDDGKIDLPENVEDIKLDSFIRKGAKKEMALVTDTELLQRFYGKDEELDNTDKFLRNYILLEGWKDKFRTKENLQEMAVVDKEDEERDIEVDEYESKHNFRFEDSTGQYLTTYSREYQDSMRRKDDTRKDKRVDKKER
jgi:protein KRI1